MNNFILYAAVPLILLGAPGCQDADEIALPKLEFTEENELVRPLDYREWIYVTSGLGMNYMPVPTEEPVFDNVFVLPAAYQAFLKTGKWPDQTIFVLELRASTGEGSINEAGHFQQEIVGLEASVKDEERFPEEGWAYFGFGNMFGPLRKTAKAFGPNDCYSCHKANAAVDNTFVQFYPTLFDVAKKKGTLKPGYPE